MNLNTFVKCAMILSLAAIIWSCSTTSRELKNYAYQADLTGLTLDPDHSPTAVYTRAGSPTFESYKRFIVDPVIVNYNDPKMKELNTETVAKMQSHFRDALIQSLLDGGYTVGTRTEPDTLRISLLLSGLKAPSAAANITSAITPFAISVGEVTVEAQFREATSNRLDIVAVANTQGSRLANVKPWSTWADIEAALDQWVKGIRKAIDKAHQKD